MQIFLMGAAPQSLGSRIEFPDGALREARIGELSRFLMET